jgi:hypothetical protein
LRNMFLFSSAFVYSRAALSMLILAM